MWVAVVIVPVMLLDGTEAPESNLGTGAKLVWHTPFAKFEPF